MNSFPLTEDTSCLLTLLEVYVEVSNILTMFVE